MVSPGDSRRKIRHYSSVTALLNAESRIGAVTVAGVGSSSLGAAALGRNVADVFGFDVVSIITGYGMADLPLEALGGWFFYGRLARLRNFVDVVAPSPTGAPLRQTAEATEVTRPLFSAMPGVDFPISGATSTDFQDLRALLRACPKGLRLVVGHSKGCYLIQLVLRELAARQKGTHPDWMDLTFVTLGTVVPFPRQVRQVYQFLGSLDSLGRLNSSLNVAHTVVPFAGHHLNRLVPFPFPLLVSRALEGVSFSSP